MTRLAAMLILSFLLLPFAAIAGDEAAVRDVDIAAIKAEMNGAIEAVSKIVNQPVTRLPRDRSLKVPEFRPGWFHAGALRPEFNAVDVRTTQEFPYAGKQYVTSDINRKEMFLGDELEFNRMTKFFYTDRSIPKKKLTEAEMLEINRLYRIIGAAGDKLLQVKLSRMPAREEDNFFATPQGALVALIALVFAGLFYFRKRSA